MITKLAMTFALMMLSASVIAAPTVSNGTISWPDDGWYQVQDQRTYKQVCAGGRSCEVEPGIYQVINHSTGQVFNNIRVVVDRAPTVIQPDRPTTSQDSVEVNGNVITWPNDGWYQVQDAYTYAPVCSGGRSCTVESGTYRVINHSTGERSTVKVGLGALLDAMALYPEDTLDKTYDLLYGSQSLSSAPLTVAQPCRAGGYVRRLSRPRDAADDWKDSGLHKFFKATNCSDGKVKFTGSFYTRPPAFTSGLFVLENAFLENLDTNETLYFSHKCSLNLSRGNGYGDGNARGVKLHNLSCTDGDRVRIMRKGGVAKASFSALYYSADSVEADYSDRSRQRLRGTYVRMRGINAGQIINADMKLKARSYFYGEDDPDNPIKSVNATLNLVNGKTETLNGGTTNIYSTERSSGGFYKKIDASGITQDNSFIKWVDVPLVKELYPAGN